jgi:hypothetical protein
MRIVRAVSDKDAKYAGFDFSGVRRINGEVFEWPNGRGMPVVKRDDNGLIVSGWVELVSGEDEAVPEKVPTGRKKNVPGQVDAGKGKRYASSGKDLAPGTRASDRVIG